MELRVTQLCLVGLLLTLSAKPGATQSTPAFSEPFTLLAVDASELKQGTSVAVSRRANQVPHDLIMVSSKGATPEDVAGAVIMLGYLRARDGARVTQDIRISPNVKLSPSEAGELLQQAAQELRKLAAAEPREVAGIGTVRAIQVIPSRSSKLAPRKP